MKKVLLVVTALILAGIGVAGATGYFAAISNEGKVKITATTNADLALEINDEDWTGPESISRDVAKYVAGTNQNKAYVRLNFGKMQPWSTYEYKDILKITNNKPYGVWVGAKVEGDLLIRPNYCMAISIAEKCAQAKNTSPNFWSCPCCRAPWFMANPMGWPMWPYSYVVYRGGGGDMNDGMTCPGYCCKGIPQYGKVRLLPGETKYVSFCIMNDKDKWTGLMEGTITFTAERTEPGYWP